MARLATPPDTPPSPKPRQSTTDAATSPRAVRTRRNAVLGGAPTAFGRIISDDIEKWKKVVKFANIKPD
jgi:hypothetical protein